MKVHEINILRSGEGFVLTADNRHPMHGGVNGADVVEDFYRREQVQHYFENPEDVVTAIGRLLRDGVE